MTSNRIKRHKINLLESFGYVKDDWFDFTQIECYFRKKDNSSAFQVLSDKTCNDLDLQELFMYIDRTHSKVGQQFLYNKLRTIPFRSKENDENERFIKEFINNPDFRVSIQCQLCKLSESEAYYISSLFQDELLQPPKLYFVVRLLSLTSVLCLITSFFIPNVFGVIWRFYYQYGDSLLE